MKILLTISGLVFHKDEGAKNRLNSFIDSYSEKGHEVHVLLFFSLRSFLYIFNKSDYLNENAKWYLFPSLPISYNKALTKLATFLDQIIFGLFTRFKSYDIIQAEVSGVIGRWKPKDCLFITDFHGDSVSETEFRNNNEENWLSRCIKKGQKISLAYSDSIIVVSKELKKRLEENTGTDINSFNIISCGVETQRFEKAKSANISKKLDNRIVLGYLGGLQEWQNIDTILDITLKLRELDSRVYFMLFTNSDLNGYQPKLDKLGEDNYLIKSLSFNEVPSYLKRLDAGFLIRDDIPLNIVASPTKLAEYLAAGIPVICTQYSGDYNRSITHQREGFVLQDTKITNDELDSLYAYLKEIKRNRENFSEKCLAAVRDRSWNNEFLNFIDNAIY